MASVENNPYQPYTSVDIGFPSVIPPILAMILALSTKEVISSLFVGALSAAIIYSVAIMSGMVVVDGSANPLNIMYTVMSAKIGGNVYICLFILFIGALINLVSVSGGSRAYGVWAKKTIKGRKRSMFSTAALGSMMFLDDYFNSITTSTVMQTVMEVNNVSKAKTAYIIHTLSTNMCITVPLTSWAAAIVSQIAAQKKDAFKVFLSAIPFNIYSILSFILMIVVIAFDFDFGKMKFYEDNARLGLSETNTVKREIDNADSPKSAQENSDNEKTTTSNESVSQPNAEATMWDLLLPIIVMVVLAVFFMFQLGGMWDGEGKDVAAVLGDTDAPKALLFACSIALATTLAIYVPRKLMTFAEWINNFLEGMKSMVSTLVILVLAWSVSGTSGDLLQTGKYIGKLVEESSLPQQLIPALVFLVGMGLSFATGTAWGTFSLLIPIALSICASDDTNKYLVPSIASCLCGAVFGNNTSPISDTTILVSSTLDCPFLLHVSTQLPYAVLTASISLVGFLVAGFTGGNLVITWIVSLLLLAAVLVFIWFHQKNTSLERRKLPYEIKNTDDIKKEGGDVCIEMSEMSEDIIKPLSNDADLDFPNSTANEE